MNTDVLIVGGGLAGLALAMQLQRAGRDYLLVEARARLGGRILSLRSQGGDDPAARYDLGPAWYWPGQPKMARLVSALGLAVFEQYAEGKLVFQDRDGAIQRDLDFATMAGSLRITGGITSLIDKLAQGIPAHRMRLRAKVVKLALAADGVGATLVTESGAVQIQSNKAVLALPPRLAAASITFAPDPGSAALHTMRTIPTWMAGHAKIIAVYEQPFWRAAGLSGDGISHRGPLAEVHDASPASGSEGALFGFVGVPRSVRQAAGFDLAVLAVEQLAEMFGERAAQPLDVLLQDWAGEAFTATDEDSSEQPQGHHHYQLSPALSHLWDGKLVLGSSEMASGFGGYLEGALEAAESVAARI